VASAPKRGDGTDLLGVLRVLGDTPARVREISGPIPRKGTEVEENNRHSGIERIMFVHFDEEARGGETKGKSNTSDSLNKMGIYT